jgi:hypothetical protein
MRVRRIHNAAGTGSAVERDPTCILHYYANGKRMILTASDINSPT